MERGEEAKAVGVGAWKQRTLRVYYVCVTDWGDGGVAFQIGLGLQGKIGWPSASPVRYIWKQFHDNFF